MKELNDKKKHKLMVNSKEFLLRGDKNTKKRRNNDNGFLSFTCSFIVLFFRVSHISDFLESFLVEKKTFGFW